MATYTANADSVRQLLFTTSLGNFNCQIFHTSDYASTDLNSGDTLTVNHSAFLLPLNSDAFLISDGVDPLSPISLNNTMTIEGVPDNITVTRTGTYALRTVYGNSDVTLSAVHNSSTSFSPIYPRLVELSDGVILGGVSSLAQSKNYATIDTTGTFPHFTYTREQTLNISTTYNDDGILFANIILRNETQEDTDPYSGGGSSGGGGGEGDFDDTSDTIPIPSLPSISGLNTGFFTAFVCTQAQLQDVSNYLWTDVISDILDTTTGLSEKVDALKKMVTSPYDAIMGCSLVPVSPPTGGSKEVKMYGVVKTGISLPYASSRWVEVDCGTLNIHEFWGSYLDYSPYTKTTSLYLPYIGVVSVDIDLIMAKSLQVVYHVDILSGICIAYIVVDGSVKFQYQGHCSTSIPVTSIDFSGTIQSGLGLVGNIANVVSSGVSGAVGSAISQAPSVASNVMGMKPDIKSGGGVGSSGGILGVQKPFLIIERPKQSVPAFQNGFSGYPCNMTKKLGDLSGYTEVERINLTNISLTEEEKNELLEILESGVYL